jgi:hypothetical protein
MGHGSYIRMVRRNGCQMKKTRKHYRIMILNGTMTAWNIVAIADLPQDNDGDDPYFESLGFHRYKDSLVALVQWLVSRVTASYECSKVKRSPLKKWWQQGWTHPYHWRFDDNLWSVQGDWLVGPGEWNISRAGFQMVSESITPQRMIWRE